GAESRLEPPLLHCFDSFFFKAQARTLHDLDFNRAAVRGNDGLKHNWALIFRLAGFFGILGVRAVSAGRIADAARARMEITAARAAARSWTQAAAFAGANTSACASTDAAAAARAS